MSEDPDFHGMQIIFRFFPLIGAGQAIIENSSFFEVFPYWPS